MKSNRYTLNRYLLVWWWVSTLFLMSAGVIQGKTFIYTDENDYLNGLTSMGYSFFKEGFEDDAIWGVARRPALASSVSSQGILWTSNHPHSNGISTGNGAALSGNWGVYDPAHGAATGLAYQCDVEMPPPACLYRDGVSGTVVTGMGPLSGVAGWFTGMTGAKIAIVLNRTTEIELGRLGRNGVQFFGVIETDGFTTFQVLEAEGKVGDKLLIFADDFTFGRIKP